MAIKNVDAATVKQWLDAGEAVLVDVREPAEHHAEKIDGAVLRPLSDFSKQMLPDTHGKKLIIHCHSGKRGGNACKKLLSEEFSQDIYHLEGGITEWKKLGFPVQVSGRKILPLDRQVQLTIGLLVMTSSVLAYVVSPLFLLLTGFFGAGLTFAGLTGFCGLAIVMAKMPWNKC